MTNDKYASEVVTISFDMAHSIRDWDTFLLLLLLVALIIAITGRVAELARLLCPIFAVRADVSPFVTLQPPLR